MGQPTLANPEDFSRIDGLANIGSGFAPTECIRMLTGPGIFSRKWFQCQWHSSKAPDGVNTLQSWDSFFESVPRPGTAFYTLMCIVIYGHLGTLSQNCSEPQDRVLHPPVKLKCIEVLGLCPKAVPDPGMEPDTLKSNEMCWGLGTLSHK